MNLNQRDAVMSNDDIFTGDDLMAMREELRHCADSPHLSEVFRTACRNLVEAIEEATAADARLEAALSAYLETGTREVLLHQQEEGSC
jgi:hypothetical protein